MPKKTITLPCEVGDIVYDIIRFSSGFEVDFGVVYKITIHEGNHIIIHVSKNSTVYPYASSSFGRTIFLDENDADNRCEELNMRCKNNEC